MTSDQGGRYGDPTGRPEGGSEPPPENRPGPPPPQGWQAPPPQQGWYAPPQGWQPPPGQQWPGYGAPPPPPPPPPPGSAERPVTVRAGIGAFVATVVLGLVGTAVGFANFDRIREQAVDRAGAGLSGDERETAREIADLVVQFSLVAGLLFTAVYLLVVWFAWQGRNWARVVLWVLGGLAVLSGLAGMGGGGTGVGYLDGLNTFSLLFTLAGVVLLALAPSNEWYRYKRWQRSTGQRA